MGFNIVFMGSPDFALPILKILAYKFNVSGVVTQPDKPAGRGKKLTSPPVKELATSLSIPFIQPRRMHEAEAMSWLQSLHPEMIVVAAFGQILKTDVLDLPKYGCINVHASLLPRWRGAAPIQAAILNGDPETGVTIMKMDPGVDTGPILSQKATRIRAGETSGELSSRLSNLGAELLSDTLPGYIEGKVIPKSQDESLATKAPMLRKEDGALDFSQPAEFLERKVRAYNPWPGAFTDWQERTFKILRARQYPFDRAVPGEKYIIDSFPGFGTKEGILLLDEVQLAGKKPMAGDVFLRGARGWVNA